MSEMTDRVARVIYAKLAAYTNPIQGFSSDAFDKESAFRKEQMRQWARAAIEVMREPTEAMKEAGGTGVPSEGYHPKADARIAENIWQAMIDAARK